MQQQLIWHQGFISAHERQTALRQRPLTVWLTGLSGAGKSTLAVALDKRLVQEGHFGYVLDGDNVRHGLNSDLGFSPQDRQENIRRVAEVARLMNDAGLIVVTAFISPYREDRERARAIIGSEQFIEVHVSTPLAICEQRDTKGFYQRARQGELAEFTGVSAPYEAPHAPALAIDTSQAGIDDCIDRVLAVLRPLISLDPKPDHSAD